MKVSKGTLDSILSQLDKTIEENEDEDDSDKEFAQEVRNLKEKLGNDPEVASIITTFQKLSWDLEAFTDFVLENVINPEDAKSLIGEAAYRAGEWDT